MSYQISEIGLHLYSRCPYAYYLRYERRLSSNEFYGSASLRSALHQALAMFHRDWHYHDAIPDLQWIYRCWNECLAGLTPSQVEEGQILLESYYEKFIASTPSLRQSLAVEGKIQAYFQAQNIEFCFTGQYDRIDFLPKGLELINYKSDRDFKVPEADEIDLQIGLYSLAIEYIYHQSLKYLSFLILKTGEKIRFKTTLTQKKKAQMVMSDLGSQLRHNAGWEPNPHCDRCDRCSYARYCPAITNNPDSIPARSKTSQDLQLALSMSF